MAAAFAAFVALGCGASSSKSEAGTGATAGGTGGGAGDGGGAGQNGSPGGSTGSDAGSSGRSGEAGDGPAEGGAAGNGGMAGGGGAAGGGAAGGGGAGREPTCSFEVVDHETDCPDPCPIETDARIRCEDSEFGKFGFRVGAAPETTYLAFTSLNLALVGEHPRRCDGARRLDGEPHPRAADGDRAVSSNACFDRARLTARR